MSPKNEVLSVSIEVFKTLPYAEPVNQKFILNDFIIMIFEGYYVPKGFIMTHFN